MTVYKLYSSCISSIENPMRTLSSFSCQLELGVDLSCLGQSLTKNSFLFSKKREYDNILKEQQTLFSTNQRKGQLFLDFENKKQHIIKPTYAQYSSWLFSIGFTNTLCTQFTYITIGYAPIGKYYYREQLLLGYFCFPYVEFSDYSLDSSKYKIFNMNKEYGLKRKHFQLILCFSTISLI